MRVRLAAVALLAIGALGFVGYQNYARAKLEDEVANGLLEFCPEECRLFPAELKNATDDELKVLKDYIQAEQSYATMKEYLNKIRSTVDDPSSTTDDTKSYALMLQVSALLAHDAAARIPQDYTGPLASRIKDRAKVIAAEAEPYRGITEEQVAAMRGAELEELIKQRKIQLGMTPEMVRRAWGEPDHINRTVTTTGVHEQWVYKGEKDVYLYFDDGVLTSFQD